MNTAVLLSKLDTELPAVHKFQLLRQSLKGNALKVIESIPVAGTNLQRAWTSLCDRFDDTQKLQQLYIRDLDTIDGMKVTSVEQLRTNLEKINVNREALRTLGSEVDKWDELLVSKLITSFDPETCTYYAMTLGMTSRTTNTKVTWDQVKTFVNQRCLALEGAALIAPAPKRGIPFKKSTAMAAQHSSYTDTRPKLKCYICAAPHVLRKCSKFLKMTPEKRCDLIKEKKLCVNCFSSNHDVSSCPTSLECGTCKRRHNTLLHWSKRPPAGLTAEQGDWRSS